MSDPAHSIDDRQVKALDAKVDAAIQLVARLHDALLDVKRAISHENPVRDVLALYDELWINLYARNAKPVVHYEFNRVVDPAHVKRLLKVFDTNTLKQRVTRYFLDRDLFLVKNGHPFNLFLSRLNTYGVVNVPSPSQAVTTAERERALQMRKAWGGCGHKPRCASSGACVLAIITKWRAQEQQVEVI